MRESKPCCINFFDRLTSRSRFQHGKLWQSQNERVLHSSDQHGDHQAWEHLLLMKLWLDFMVVTVPNSMHPRNKSNGALRCSTWLIPRRVSSWHSSMHRADTLEELFQISNHSLTLVGLSCTLCGIISIAIITYTWIGTIQAYLWHSHWLLTTTPSLALSWKVSQTLSHSSRVITYPLGAT